MKCKECGGEFTPSKYSPKQVFCSKKCNGIYRMEHFDPDKEQCEFREEYEEFDIKDEEILSHDRFHHSRKGCCLEFKPKKSIYGWRYYSVHCKTHEVDCSRTGWQWHWWGGTNSCKLKID